MISLINKDTFQVIQIEDYKISQYPYTDWYIAPNTSIPNNIKNLSTGGTVNILKYKYKVCTGFALYSEAEIAANNSKELLNNRKNKFRNKAILVYGVTNLLLSVFELIPFSILCQTSPKISYYTIDVDNVLYSYACFDYINQAHWDILKKHVGTILTLETFDGDDIEVKVNDKFKYIV